MMFLLALVLAEPGAIPAGEPLVEEIKGADKAFFTTFFDDCDPKRLTAMVAPDFEMYHDRDGVVASSGPNFIKLYAKQCEAKKAPGSWRSRRALVVETLHVKPIPAYGAIEEGDHMFFERKGDGPEKLAGRAHFVQLWKRAPVGWQLARVFRYSHRAADVAKP